MLPLLFFAAAGLAAPPAAAQEAADSGGARVASFMPEAEFYPQYTADPLRPQSAVVIPTVPDSEIPDTGAARFALRLGGRFGLVRWHREETPDRG